MRVVFNSGDSEGLWTTGGQMWGDRVDVYYYVGKLHFFPLFFFIQLPPQVAKRGDRWSIGGVKYSPSQLSLVLFSFFFPGKRQIFQLRFMRTFMEGERESFFRIPLIRSCISKILFYLFTFFFFHKNRKKSLFFLFIPSCSFYLFDYNK